MAKKTRILIADDESINRDFFDVMLSKLGFDVELAEDGEEALEKIKKSPPDLLILDPIMPGLSGWRVTRLLKTDAEYRAYQDLPIIMLSAMDDVQDKVEGYELGVEDYILKPFNFSEVLARIRAVLRSRELGRQVALKERKIALVESLNNSLLYVTRHLKDPVVSLLTLAKELDLSDKGAVEGFVKKVIKEFDESLAAIRGLEEEIADLESEGKKLSRSGIDLKELEEKFQKHFELAKKIQNGLNEVLP